MIDRGRSTDTELSAGFSLIELLVVVVVIGILAGIAIPLLLSQRDKGYDALAKSDLRNVSTHEYGYLNGPSSTFISTSAINDFPPGTIVDAKWSAGTQTAVVANGALGFCAVTKSRSGNYFVWDSTGVGLSKLYTAPPPSSDFAGGTCESGIPAIP